MSVSHPLRILHFCKILFWESQDDQNRVSIPALCQKPRIKNGYLTVRKEQYIESENVTVHCDDGYGTVGSPFLSCSENGMWLPTVPKCKWVSGTHFRMSYHVLKLVIGVRALSTNVDEIWLLSGLLSELLKSASKHLMGSLKQVLILSFSSKKNQASREEGSLDPGHLAPRPMLSTIHALILSRRQNSSFSRPWRSLPDVFCRLAPSSLPQQLFTTMRSGGPRVQGPRANTLLRQRIFSLLPPALRMVTLL